MKLIVGADSSIGKNLFSHWISGGSEIRGTTRRLNDPTHIYLDLLNVEAFVPPDECFDCVVLLAGLTDVKYCDINKKVSRKVNVDAIKAVIKKLSHASNYFLFLSTSLVFDGEKDFYTPNDKTNPKTQYGRDKVRVEQFILNESKGGVLRIDKVIDQSKPLFDNWRSSLAKKNPIEAYSDLFFSPVDMSAVIDKIDCMVSNKRFGIQHLPGNGVISYYEFAKEIARELKVSTSLVKPIKSSLTNRKTVKLC